MITLRYICKPVKQTAELLDVERMMGGESVQLLPVLCLNTGINLPGTGETLEIIKDKLF